ncbi:ParA family protein [uncultured Microbacterium sp.]|uniref:AAA domain-containing protein n=1 Tax=uncultured Microbacterium sp. TaxID=191216 RepID=A0A1Y5NYZ6_9MICO|nr:ParA family protein [uncultured Microbacterium sp.]SBS71692.1 conserved hypothetical protein [uncultured Microbacterium sp.]
MNSGTEPARAHVRVTGESAEFALAGAEVESLSAADADGIRQLIVTRARDEAARIGEPVELSTSGDHGEHTLQVEPDGELIVQMTDKTVTRAELREQAWWTTDAVPAPWTSTLDDGDDDDLDEPAASVPEPLAPDLGTPQFAFTVPEDLGPYEPSEPAPDDDDDDVEDAVSPWAPVSADGPADHAAEPADAPSTDGAADAPAGTEPTDEPIDAEGTESTDEPNDTEDPESADAPPEFVSPPAMPTGLTDIPPVPVLSGPLATFGESARPSFIEPASEHPAKLDGWRAFLAQLGIPMRPSRAAIQRAEWEMAVSRHWAGCRTIAVANGKGGVGKTMTTAVLAAVYARHGGGTVLAWDNNDTRGTLGWRTEQGDYDTTIRDLLPHAARLLETTASVSDIARYVHHQTVDRYDVLRSNPELLAADQRITTADFDLLMQVAARYYRMVIFDSGNDESADRWLRMIDSAHQLVVPTLAAPESAESAALLLDALRRRDEHSRRLADNAVVIVSQSERSNAAAVQEIAEGFVGHVRAVEVIPFDDALKAGRIRYGSLQPKTGDAWMRAAAAVADGL